MHGDRLRFTFPRPLLDRSGCDMSFSGLKTALLSAAEKSLLTTAKLYPALGDWRDKYDELLKQVQSAAGKPAVGLPPTNSSSTE